MKPKLVITRGTTIALCLYSKFFWLRCLNLVLLNLGFYILYSSQQKKSATQWNLTPLADASINSTGFPGVAEYIRYSKNRLRLETLKYEKPISKHIGDVINTINYTFVGKRNRIMCDNEVDVLAVVISATENSLRRQIVRRTWARELRQGDNKDIASFKTKVIFLLGKPKYKYDTEKIEKENLYHRDIVHVDLLDSYQNLTLKSIALLEWTFKNCPSANFVLKIDDDVYLNIKLFKSFLRYSQQNGFGSRAVIFGKQLPLNNGPVREKRKYSNASSIK